MPRPADHRLAFGSRRGGVLLEVLLSLALFAGSGAFALVALGSVLSALDRQQRMQLAVDLARSKMAELEAGLTTIELLRDDEGTVRSVGSLQIGADFAVGPDAPWPWQVEVSTSPSAFAGLSMVELTVLEGESAGDAAGVQYTLRQLVALSERQRRQPADDDLLKGLEAPTQEPQQPQGPGSASGPPAPEPRGQPETRP